MVFSGMFSCVVVGLLECRSAGEPWPLIGWMLAPSLVGAAIGLGAMRICQLAALTSDPWLCPVALMFAAAAALVAGAIVANATWPPSTAGSDCGIQLAAVGVLGAIHGISGAALSGLLWFALGPSIGTAMT